MLAGGLWAGPVHKPSLVPCGKPLVARLKAPTVSHSRGLPKAWVSHKGGTDAQGGPGHVAPPELADLHPAIALLLSPGLAPVWCLLPAAVQAALLACIIT